MDKSKMTVLVISSDYPRTDNIYGDVFVHARLKHYQKFFNVYVVGLNTSMPHIRDYTYEGIGAYITNTLSDFYKKITDINPDVIVGHLIHHRYLDFLSSLNKPQVYFFHGYEATSWKRRLMNYDSLGSLRYLVPYAIRNEKQLRSLRRLVERSNENPDVRFVFVSNWLKTAATADLKIQFKNAHVIPNGVDIKRFAFTIKPDTQRKKILIIRSFKANNYANDLAIDAILLLKDRPFFDDLQFSIYGEGYLFDKLTDKIKHLGNVSLHNHFLENKDIPELHRSNGIFLCPSRLDSQGVSMCEAMSSGLVPVTCAVGGIPEYATNGISAFMTSNAKEIADRIEYLYYNPEVFAEMSAAAHREIESKCDLSKTARVEIDLIASLAASKLNYDLGYRQCTRCILDSHDDPGIFFDSNGVCSYCHNYNELDAKFVRKGDVGRNELLKIAADIKKEGVGKRYDCIIGLSGGVDSTYLALQAKLLGLKPLAVHFDNGWNSELATNNIENIVTKLDIDLDTYVIDWEEFKDLQLAFLKASVIDIEMITDHAILATLNRLALKYKIKYILSGTNIVTEAILPTNWTHPKDDHVHIRAINRLFGKLPIKRYPLFTSSLKAQARIAGIKSVSLLNYMPYNKAEVKKEIAEKLGWRDYGGKHYESIFTRFYQGYILPVKFKVDKRKAHLSNLICSGQITREEALLEMSRPGYDEKIKNEDHQFVLKKLGLTNDEFQKILSLPIKPHREYPVNKSIFDRFVILSVLRPVYRIIRSWRSGL